MTRHRDPRTPPRLPARPRIGSICTGYGGLDTAAQQVIGGQVVWVADPDPNVSIVLASRYPHAPNLGDISRVDWADIPPVDVLTAGFPCQDISTAGRGAGITGGTRSGIWTHIAHAIGILQPRLVFVENVAALRWPGRGLDTVLSDLATRGYYAKWTCLAAADIGAVHRRERLFLIAWPHRPHA